MTDTPKSIVFFDGVCVLCNASVRFVLKHDQHHTIYFSTLQSDVANEYLLQIPEEIKKKDSIIFYTNGVYYTESTAALKIAQHFHWKWYFIQILWLVPKSIRDFFYRIIAKYRYQWFGKKDTCSLPSPNHVQRFLD